MLNDGRVGGIEYYKSLLNQRESIQGPSGLVSPWQKLQDYCNKMSADQQNFVEKNLEVQRIKSAMMDSFLLYLFERYKDEFIQIDNFHQLCDNYINTVIETGNKYSAEITNVIDENASLKAKLAELERKLNEQPNTNGT